MSLSTLINQVIEEHPLSNPWDVAEMVAKLTPDDDARAFYVEALVPSVRIALANKRNAAISATRRTQSGSRRPQSSKVDRVRDAWQAALNALVAVGSNEWKPLRECTAEDLRVVIDGRMRHIESVRSQVSYYERLVDALMDQDVSTVGELSGPVS
ncbi:hypothetical protein [Mycolicibacterium palauense]|uniref:hypothetical protein n=1 Tax=Mycolicibacterium palauense TaxID=2034511 RepID=UPI000BFEB7BB|nr:hypothetical protein [Mycolicibacterium palauense]